MDEAPNRYRRSLRELVGDPVRTDDANHLYIAAEEDFDAAIPMILEELAANRSTNLRESCIFLMGCYADPKLVGHILKSLKLEKDFDRKARTEEYIYINCLLDLGETVLKPMLKVWKDPESHSYVRSVARNYLTRRLARQ